MAIKKVYCYLVSTVEGCDFANVLLNPQCHEPISLDKKEIEIKYVQEHSGQTNCREMSVWHNTNQNPEHRNKTL